jgi:hypothetical protein
MNTRRRLKVSLACACLLALPVAYAAHISKADYKVAIEKCDALAGDARNNCVAAAKARFGKN